MSVPKDFVKSGAQYQNSYLHPEYTSLDSVSTETELAFRSDDAAQNAVVSSTVDIAEERRQNNDHNLTSHGSCIRYFIRDEGHKTEEVPSGERQLGLSEILASSRLELGPPDSCHDLGLSSSMPALVFQSAEKDDEEVGSDEETINTITLTAEEMEKLNANHRIEILARSPGGTDQKLFFVLDEKDSSTIYSEDNQHSPEVDPLPGQTSFRENCKGISIQGSSATASRRTEAEMGRRETSGKTLKHTITSSRVGTAASDPASVRTAGTPADNLKGSTAMHRDQPYERGIRSSSEISFHAASDERPCSEQKKHGSKISTGESIVHESRHSYEAERVNVSDPPPKVIVAEHWNSRQNHHPVYQGEEAMNLDALNVFPRTRQYAANCEEPQNLAYVPRARSGSDFGAETNAAAHSNSPTLYPSEDFNRPKFTSNGRDNTRFELYAYPRNITNSDAYYPMGETVCEYVQTEGLPLSSDNLRCQYPSLDSSRAEGNANTFIDGNNMQYFCRDGSFSRYFHDVKLLPLSYSKDSYRHTDSAENFHDVAALESAKYMYVRPMRGRGVRGQGPRTRARGRRSTAGRQYLQHRLLWARYTGRSPEALSRVLQTIQDRCGIRPTNQSPSFNWDGMNQDTSVLYPAHHLEPVPAAGNNIVIGEGDRLARVAVTDSSAGLPRPASVQTVVYQCQPPFNVNVSSSKKGVDETHDARCDTAVPTCLEKNGNERPVARVSINSVSPQIPSDKQLPVDKEKVTEEDLTAAGSVWKEEAKKPITLAAMTNAGDGFVCMKLTVQDDVKESKNEESPRLLAVHTKHVDDTEHKRSSGDSRANLARCAQRSETECSQTGSEGFIRDDYIPPAIFPTNTAEDSLCSSTDRTVVAEDKNSGVKKSTSIVRNQMHKYDRSDAHNLRQGEDTSAAVFRGNINSDRQDITVDNCHGIDASTTGKAAVTTNVIDANLEPAESNGKENARCVRVTVTGACEAEDKRTPQYAKDEKQDEVLEIPPTPSKKVKFGNRVHNIETNWMKGNKITKTTLNDKEKEEREREISESACQIEQKHISKKKDGRSFNEPVLGAVVSEALVKVVCASEVPPSSCEKKLRKSSCKNPDIQPAGVQTRKKQVRRSLFPSPGKPTRLNSEESQHVATDHNSSMDTPGNFKQQATPANVYTGQEIASGNGDTHPSVSQFLQAAAAGGININIHVSNDVIKDRHKESTRTPPNDSDAGRRSTGMRSTLTGKRLAVEQSTDDLAVKRPNYSENRIGQHGQNQRTLESADLQAHTSHHSNIRNTATFGNRCVDYGGDGFSAAQLQSPGYSSSTPDGLDSYYTTNYTHQYAWPVYANSQNSTSRLPTVFERPDPFSSSYTPPQQRPQHIKCHEVISDQYLLALESAVRASQELENKDMNGNPSTVKKLRKVGQDNERDFLVVETRKHRWFLGDSPLRAYPPYPGGEANSFYVSPDAAHTLHNLQSYGDLYPRPIPKSDTFLDAGQSNTYGTGSLLGAAAVHSFTHDGTCAEDPRGLQLKKWPENRSASVSYMVSHHHSNSRYVAAEYGNAPVNLMRSNRQHWGLTYADNQGEANRLKFWQRNTFADSAGNFAVTEQPFRSAVSQQTPLMGMTEPADLDSRVPRKDYQGSNESHKKSESKGLTNT